MLSIVGLRGIPMVKPGDDLAELIVKRARAQKIRFRDGDIVVIAQKVVSKALGLLVDISRLKPSRRAKRLAAKAWKDARLMEAIIESSSKLLKLSPRYVVAKAKCGVVCLNAGLDKSNVKGNHIYSVLPKDPDAAAAELMAKLRGLTGRKVMVVISDSYSRPFRIGQVNFAIGVAGFDPLVDYRGTGDLFGYRLKHKRVALADEVAAAAELVMGQGKEGVPVAIVRGLGRVRPSLRSKGAKALLISEKRDIFKGSLR